MNTTANGDTANQASGKRHPAVSYSATITDPQDPDAMPMWESFDHPAIQDALQAARTYIHTAQPSDRLVDEGHGVYAIWTGTGRTSRQVGMLVIAQPE